MIRCKIILLKSFQSLNGALVLLKQKLRIGIVVGEVSGDTLGVKLMRSFREQGIDVEFEGIGGPQMIAEGLSDGHFIGDGHSRSSKRPKKIICSP